MAEIPQCVGIILDGNRRWAKERGLPGLEGHRHGLDKISDCARSAHELGVKHLALYALSTENLHRTEKEVSYFMDLAVDAAERSLGDLGRENVRVRIIGDLSLLPAQVRVAVEKVASETAENTGLCLWVCLAYGSRAEIVAAAEDAAQAGEKITEESLQRHFWSAEMPNPDIIIRPGGEKRLSNFMLWQAAYSELFFIDRMWPDFTKEDLEKVLQEYACRERRMGK